MTSISRSSPSDGTRPTPRGRAGLEPLALALLAYPALRPEAAAASFVDAEGDVADVAAALDGARAILIERFGEDADLIATLRETMWRRGRLVAKLRKGKAEAGAKFADYFDFSEPLAKVPSHRILALFRAEDEGVLDVTLDPDPATANAAMAAPEYEAAIMARFRIAEHGRPGDAWMRETVRLAWRGQGPCKPDRRPAGAAPGDGRGGGRPGLRDQPA